MQWITWFILRKWLICSGSVCVLLHLCLCTFAVPHWLPLMHAPPWLFINHSNSFATVRRVWEKIICFQIYSKLSDNFYSSFLFFTSQFVFLSQLAVVSLSHAHITCVMLVALDPTLQILTWMQALSSHGWDEYSSDTGLGRSVTWKYFKYAK